MSYIMIDGDGRIIASADWHFPGSEQCPCDVVYYPDGGLYRADALPAVYGNPGTSEQQIAGDCPSGWVMMPGPRQDNTRGVDGEITVTWLAGEDGEWHPGGDV